jgi:hypothetical protein
MKVKAIVDNCPHDRHPRGRLRDRVSDLVKSLSHLVKGTSWGNLKKRSSAIACTGRSSVSDLDYTPLQAGTREINFPTFHWAIGFAEIANHGACGLAGRCAQWKFFTDVTSLQTHTRWRCAH